MSEQIYDMVYEVCHCCFGIGYLAEEGDAECPYCDGTGFEPVDDMIDDAEEDETFMEVMGE